MPVISNGVEMSANGMGSRMAGHMKRFWADEHGATAIEYALIGSLISVFIIGALMGFSSSVVDMFFYVSDSIVGATG